MGLLTSTQATVVGDIITSPCTGHHCDGVELGQPIIVSDDPATAGWDDSAFPNGTCEVVDGALVVTPEPEPDL